MTSHALNHEEIAAPGRMAAAPAFEGRDAGVRPSTAAAAALAGMLLAVGVWGGRLDVAPAAQLTSSSSVPRSTNFQVAHRLPGEQRRSAFRMRDRSRKRPRDANQLAEPIVDITTGEGGP
jgi:hypothetical protein